MTTTRLGGSDLLDLLAKFERTIDEVSSWEINAAAYVDLRSAAALDTHEGEILLMGRPAKLVETMDGRVDHTDGPRVRVVFVDGTALGIAKEDVR